MCPNINEKNKFIKPKDLKPTDVLIFKDAGKWIVKEFKNKATGTMEAQDIFEIGILLNNDENVKTISLNKTSRDTLASKYGEETEEWVGKQAVALQMGDKTIIIPK